MQVEGKNQVSEIIKSEKTINRLYAQNNLHDNESNELIKLAKNTGIKIDFVDRAFLDRKSKTAHHQGFIAEITDFVYSDIDAILSLSKLKGEDLFVLILDGISDPHNFGAIIRSAEIAGVHGIIISEHRCCPINETVIRTSAGAISNVLICKINNIKNAIKILKDNGAWIYAAEADGESIYKTNLKGNIGIIIGSEGEGVHKSVREAADSVISLPQRGKINSLNASVACGAVLFEAIRQRGE